MRRSLVAIASLAFCLDDGVARQAVSACMAGARPDQQAPVVLKDTPVGIVLPADSRQGEEISCSVVTDPDRYKGIPALRVLDVALPLVQDARGRPSLEGIVVEAGDRKLQPATSRVVVRIDENATRIPIVLRRGAELTPMAELSVTVARSRGRHAAADHRPTPQDYETPPVYVDDNLQVIRGPFDGRSAGTEIVVDEIAAPVVAETPRAAYWRLPPGIEPGLHRITLVENDVTASFLVAVLQLVMGADRLELEKGESTRFRAVLSGLEDLPDSAWRGGAPSDLVDMAGLRRLAPDLRLPAADDAGAILLRIENATPGNASIAPAKKQAVMTLLRPADFVDGRYTFAANITSKRGGRFSMVGLVVPLLAPIKGERGDAF